MRRPVAIGILMLGIALSGCSDDDDKTTPNPAASDGPEAPDGGAAPRRDPSALPPEFIECMAEQGFEVKSSADIHSAPPQVLQACFGSIH